MGDPVTGAIFTPGMIAGNGTSATPGDSRQSAGQVMPQSQPYGHNPGSSRVLFQADGTPYRSSGRFVQKGDDKTYVDFHNINPYQQVLHAYESSNGFRDNSYLIFFPREEWYQERQKYSIRAAPGFRSVVDAMVQPVFEKEINRQTTNPMFEMFINNSDNTGTTLHDVNETAQTHARMLGVTFIVMDNFSNAGSIANLKTAIDSRTFPYIYEKLPHEVYKWKCNNFGKLEWITFYDRCELIPDPDNSKKNISRQYYRRWDVMGSTVYYEQVEKGQNNKITDVVETQATHGLGYLPVYPVIDYSKTNNLTNFPTPLLGDLANMSFVLYNVESWIMLLSVYCFPILTLPPMDGAQIALSVNNAIEIPPDAKFAPSFIAPPTTCLEVLQKTADRLEDKIYRAANQIGVSGSKVQPMASGVSKQWDFRAINSLLKKTAYAAKKLEEWCAKTFSDYTGITVEYVVDYPSEFVDSQVDNRQTQILAILKELPPEAYQRALWKESAMLTWADDPDTAIAVCNGIDKAAAQDIKDKMAMDNADNKIQQVGKVGVADTEPTAEAPSSGKPPINAGSETDMFQKAVETLISQFEAAKS